MSIEEVIKMRTALKGGENLPLFIFLNNTIHGIDESAVGSYTLWDDTNGFIYTFRPTSFAINKSPQNREGTVSLYCAPYEVIQGMEVIFLPINKIDNVASTIISSGKPISTELLAQIKYSYRDLLMGNYADMTPEDYNRIFGAGLNENDQYFKGKMKVDQETHLKMHRMDPNYNK